LGFDGEMLEFRSIIGGKCIRFVLAFMKETKKRKCLHISARKSFAPFPFSQTNRAENLKFKMALVVVVEVLTTTERNSILMNWKRRQIEHIGLHSMVKLCPPALWSLLGIDLV
jgi:hypothetical protein